MTVFTLMTVAPLVLGAIISLIVTVSLAQEKIVEDQENSAAVISELMTRRWDDTVDSLRTATVMLDRTPPDARLSLLDLVQQSCASCRAIWLLDPDGRVQRQTPASAPSPSGTVVTIADEQDDVKPLPLNSSADSTPPAVLLKLPIGRGAGAHGALMALIDLQRFGDPILESVHPEFDGYSYVFDSSGRLIVSPRPDIASAGRDLRSIGMVAAALKGQRDLGQNQAYTGLLLPRVSGVWYHMPHTGWYVMVEAPLSLSNEDNWFLFFVQIALLMLTALVALVLGRRLASTITWPIEQLQQAVARLQAGKWDGPLVVKRQDEIGQLARAFNTMAQDLHLKHTELQRQSAELAQANTALQQALEASHSANLLKSQFVATISHELRTPLTAMLGFSDMLTMGFYGRLAEDQQDAIFQISASSRHLLHLINDLLDFSKLEAGKLELHEEELPLADLIASVISTCTPEAQSKGLPIRAIVDPTLPGLVRVDPLRLRQILLNLLSNAVKFTDQGAITIRAYRATGDWSGARAAPSRPRASSAEALGERAVADRALSPASGAALAAEHLVIEVQDTGIGIAPEDQTLIFDEFRQIDGSYTRVRGGTGLGLAITRRLTELMGGDIDLSSSPGQGSCFVIRLPLKYVDSPVLK